MLVGSAGRGPHLRWHSDPSGPGLEPSIPNHYSGGGSVINALLGVPDQVVGVPNNIILS